MSVHDEIKRRGWQDPDYLGDGVYIAHDSFQFWLFTADGIQIRKAIALGHRELQLLNDYAARLTKKGTVI